ncbi:unnamed protein product [Blepharisma stoltei]|uniref:Protein kinase domain-containing protein n=1 Tax=Blepharisma stoltei TaxID=1481888 RepID=A0AAU9JQG8_9CILI|nr:unnamed protein product [Blepharisma stoltei]
MISNNSRTRIVSSGNLEKDRDDITSHLNLKKIAIAHQAFKRPSSAGLVKQKRNESMDKGDPDTTILDIVTNKAKDKGNADTKIVSKFPEEFKRKVHTRRISCPKTPIVPSTLLRNNDDNKAQGRCYTPIPVSKLQTIRRPPGESPRDDIKVEFRSPIKTPQNATKLGFNQFINTNKDASSIVKPKETIVVNLTKESSPIAKNRDGSANILAKDSSPIPKPREINITSPISKQKEIFSTDNRCKGNIEEYAIGKQIGQGAYASVKFATHTPTSRKVALKIYEKIKLLDLSRKKNVLKEIEILEMLDHPNIVKFYEIVETSRQLHIVMEYVAGCSLHGYLKRKPNRRLEENEAKKITTQIVSAIEYCHSKNVSHRDLKLENLLLDDKGEIKIIDFGFSTVQDKKSRIFCGTPSYMAPEIVTRKEYSGPPVDIWAIGVLLYVFLTGTFPFKGSNDHELYRKIRQSSYSLPQYLSRTSSSLIARILKSDPNSRPTAQEILSDPWLQDIEPTPAPKEDPATQAIVYACSINGDALDFGLIRSIKKLGFNDSELLHELQDENSKISKLYRKLKSNKDLSSDGHWDSHNKNFLSAGNRL